MSVKRTRQRIYLLRHGAVDYFTADGTPLRPDGVRLSDEGRGQAAVAAEALRTVLTTMENLYGQYRPGAGTSSSA